MKRLAFVCTLVSLASPALHAQNAREQLPSQSAYNIQQNQMRQQQNADSSFLANDRQGWIDSINNLTKLRGKLAEAWQTRGMSPQEAQDVAAAYQPDLAKDVHHASLRGKNDQEIDAMLQSALAKKDYLLADKLLIDHQLLQQRHGASTLQGGVH
jgi:hypothetical protein